MANFIQTANVKRSVRELTTPIPDVATLNTLVQGVIDTNAFQCVNFIRAGVTVPGVYTVNQTLTRYEPGSGTIVSNVSVQKDIIKVS